MRSVAFRKRLEIIECREEIKIMHQQDIIEIHKGLQKAYIDNAVNSNLAYSPQFITNDYKRGVKILTHIENQLMHCDEFSISVAFINRSGFVELAETLKELERRGIRGRILTTDYLCFSEPYALDKLASLTNIQLKIYHVKDKNNGFHTKGYLFRENGIYRIIIGSANMTQTALSTNMEWNTQLVSTEQGEMAKSIVQEFERLWKDELSKSYDEFIEDYRKIYNRKKQIERLIREQHKIALQNDIIDYDTYNLKPNKMQEEFIGNIHDLRERGATRALLISATGTGKTYASAFALKNEKPKKALFIVHREIIAKQAIKSYQKVFGNTKKLALLSGSSKEYEADILFATMSMMAKQETLNRYKPGEFEWICIDEAHHAVSPVLKRVIQYFTPDFLIGLTATDQRPDKKKLETIFGNYKTGLSLVDAMKKKIVAEANVCRIETNLDLSHIRFNGKDYINADLEKSIRVKSRNELIADVLYNYFSEGKAGQLQGVVFCVNTNHAQEMERVLNANGFSAKAYTRKTKNPDEVMQQFREKKIRFLCACEMISEGWDYPELGILVMARPTLSKVLYMQQIGRGLRRTNTKTNVFVIDVVDEYGAMAKPCSMHSIFSNPFYTAFGSILKRDYSLGDMIEVDGLHETVERIVQVDIETFEEKYGDYLNQEQLAREFYLSTGTITSWVTKGKISPDEMITFGSRKIYLFAPEHVKQIREENNIPEHTEETIKTDFFDFVEERDYSLSYKMPFLLSFLKNMNEIGDAKIDNVLTDYIAFYQDRIDKGLPVDRSSCPYNAERLKDRKYIKSNMLTNPFEKFERKRFLYYSKDLNVISMNHALFIKMSKQDFEKVKVQMEEDLEKYYERVK